VWVLDSRVRGRKVALTDYWTADFTEFKAKVESIFGPIVDIKPMVDKLVDESMWVMLREDTALQQIRVSRDGKHSQYMSAAGIWKDDKDGLDLTEPEIAAFVKGLEVGREDAQDNG
jgi:hypothetical protein